MIVERREKTSMRDDGRVTRGERREVAERADRGHLDKHLEREGERLREREIMGERERDRERARYR
jgi:hypothetical protein